MRSLILAVVMCDRRRGLTDGPAAMVGSRFQRNRGGIGLAVAVFVVGPEPVRDGSAIPEGPRSTPGFLRISTAPCGVIPIKELLRNPYDLVAPGRITLLIFFRRSLSRFWPDIGPLCQATST